MILSTLTFYMLSATVLGTSYALPDVADCSNNHSSRKTEKSCDYSLNENGYVTKASSGKPMFLEATPATVMDYYSLYQSGDDLILEDDNFSSSKTWSIVVFKNADGHVYATNYITISKDAQPDGEHWVGFVCRGHTEINKAVSPFDSARADLCSGHDNERGLELPPSTEAAKRYGLVVTLPTYDNLTKIQSASTYVFISYDSPSATSILCIDGCAANGGFAHMGGLIGKSMWIDMKIILAKDGVAHGTYSYTKIGSPISLSGSLQENKLSLSEIDSITNESRAQFLGTKFGSSYIGNWASGKKIYPLFLAERIY